MRKLLSFLLVIVVSLSFTSCSLWDLRIDFNQSQEVKSPNSSLSLKFPKSWSELKLNEQATIQMGRGSKEQYMVVIEESGSDFSTGYDLSRYVLMIRINMKRTLQECHCSETTDTKIGQDIPARQFEISGLVNEIKAKYLVTCAEVDGIFYQFTAWSLQSKYDEAKPAFEYILKSASF